MSPVRHLGLTSALVCLLFVTSGTTSVPFLESDHVTLVTCTHERTNLVLLKVSEAGEEGNIAAFNEIENSCLGNFTLYACSTDREVKVKAVVDEGRNQTIRCHAYVKQDLHVVHKYIGAVNITTPDRTSRTETTQGLQVQGLQVQGLHTQGLQGLHTQGLQAQGAHTQGLKGQGLQVQGLQGLHTQGLHTQGLQGLHTQGLQAQGLQAQGISSTTVQSPLRDQLRDTSPPSHISPEASGKQENIVTSDALGVSTKGHQGQLETTETRGPSTGGGGQQDSPHVPVTSPLTVWMLGAVSAGLVLLAGLAALLALNLRREKRHCHKLMYRIPESLPLHTSRPPVDSNSYLPSVPSCSPFNPHEGASSRQTPCRRSSSYLYRHLAVRSHPVPGSYGDVYLTPRTSSSCSTSPLTLQSCGLTTDQWPQQGNPCMEPRARQTTRMFEENGDDAGEVNIYSTVTEVTTGERVDCTSAKSFM